MYTSTFTGFLGKDPEMSFTPNGVAKTKFTVAVSGWDSLEKVKTTQWLNVICWRALAEACNENLGRGSKVLVVGTPSERQYKAKDGSTQVWREITASEVEFLSPKGNVRTEIDPNSYEGPM